MPPTRRSRAVSTHEGEDATALQPRPPSPPPPELQALRRHWKWAAASQFLTLFRPLLGAEQILLTDVEQDLSAGTRVALPRLMGRLLSQLNQDRKITSENWQPFLRRQFARRAPDDSPWPPLGRQQSQAAPTPASELQQDVSEEQEREQKEEPEDVKMETSTEPKLEGAEAPEPAKQEPEEPSVKKEEQEQDQETPQDVDWFTFPMETKLDSLHALCEWFFHNPNRIRLAMKDDDEYAQWRIEPVGYDAELDAYWFLGGDRLWRQRRQNAPIRVRTGIKRKRPPAGGGQRKRVALEAVPPPPPKRSAGRSTRTSARAGAEALPMETRRERTTRSSRRGDDDAWQEVPDDWLRPGTSSATPEVNGRENGSEEKTNGVVHAKEEEGGKENGEKKGKEEEGKVEEDKEKTVGLKEETKMPEPAGDNGVSDEVKAMLGLDSDSELTELSSEEDGDGGAGVKTEDEGSEGSSSSGSEDSEDEYPEFFSDYRPPSSPPPGFVEWETVCVTKSEWAEFPTRFENSSNRHERALHKRLLNNVLPIVMDAFHQEEERVRALAKTAEPSIKRSSRLAIKESERVQHEQTRTQTKAPARGSGAGTAKADRAARAELRARRGEEERIKRELAEAEDLEDDPGSRESVAAEPAPAASSSTAPAKNGNNGVNGKRKRPQPKKGADKPPPKKKQRTTYEEDDDEDDDDEDEDDDSGDDYEDAKDGDYNEDDEEDWYLDCEICGKKGLNVVSTLLPFVAYVSPIRKNDGLAVACCEGCNKWQHMKCHDEVDERAGRKPRKWDEIDFTCRVCATKSRSKSGSPRKSNAHAAQQAQQSTFSVQQQMQQRHPQYMQQQQQQSNEAVLHQMLAQVEASRRPDGTFDPVLYEKYRMAQTQVLLQQHIQEYSQKQANLQAQLNQAQASGQYNAQQLQSLHAQATQRLQQHQSQIQTLQMQLQTGFSQPTLARSSSFPGAGVPTGGQVQGSSGQMGGGQGPHNSAEMVAAYHQQQQRDALLRQQMAIQQQQRQPLQATQSAPNVMSMSNPQMQQYMAQQQPQQQHLQQLRPQSSSGMLAGMTQQQQQAFTLAQLQQQRRNSSHSPVQAQFGAPERGSHSPHLHQQQQQQQAQVKLVPPSHPAYQQQQQQLLNLQAIAQTHGVAALTQQQMLYLQAFQLQQAAGMNAGPSVTGTSGAQAQQIALQHQQMLQQQAARQQQQQWVGGGGGGQDMLPSMGDQMRMMNQARVASQGSQFVQQRQSPIPGQHASPSLQQMSQMSQQSGQGMSQMSLPPMASQSPVQSQQQYMQQMQSPSLGHQQSGGQYLQQQMQSPSLGQQSGQFATPTNLGHQSSMQSPAQMHPAHSQSPIDASFRQQTQTPPQPQVTSISPHQLMNNVPTPTPPPIPESTSQS
ncbi:hypothetical protein AURDEDRAFT_161150 [Auricularia subglabra TFB-10046 SS5]|nr:hypothetical protein AURDEDRAFT_161150 [Auricularia subglabra TFB-10046 SS5]